MKKGKKESFDIPNQNGRIKLKDEFDRVIPKFLTPISELGDRIDDSLYLLRRDGSFVFTHGYYHPRKGYIIGKIIHYPTPTGDELIWGRRYQSMHKKWVDGRHVAVTNDLQLKKAFEIDPFLDPRRPRPLIADFTLEFPLKDFVGFFEPRHCLLECAKLYPQVGEWAEITAKLMDFPIEKMGVTGSLAFGVVEEADMDFDVIFRGDLEENNRALTRIYEIAAQPGKRVFEFGKYWPIRIYHRNILICPFFVYQNWEDVPLTDAEITLEREDISGTAVVSDDFQNSYLPIYLQLKDVEIEGESFADIPLISYDGSIRGEFRTGDRLRFTGKLLKIKDKKGEYPAVAVDIYYNISSISQGRET